MSSSNSALAEHAGTQLHLRRKVVLADIRTRLHNSDDPDRMVLTSHLEEVGDWAESGIFNETNIALLGNELAELRAIDAALLRIEAGNYGICIECGDAIPEDRMQAQPTALRCLACQIDADKRQGSPHGTGF